MFDKLSAKSFRNSAHAGDYVEVEFDTYVDNRGKEEVLDVQFSLHYLEAGEGQPLILVHGIGQSIYTWRKNFEELSQQFHVYAIDLPGHGFSGKPQISYSVEEFALALEAFLNAKRIERAHFCAFGESAVYVLDFAIHNPQRCGRIVLLSPVIAEDARGSRRGIQSVFGTAAQKMMLSPALMRGVLGDCYFDQTLVTEEVVTEYLQGIADREFKQISRLCMANFYDADVIENIASVKHPVLLCVGTDDKITAGTENSALTLGFENGSMLTVRNCGFLLHEEKSEKINEAIVAFLRME